MGNQSRLGLRRNDLRSNLIMKRSAPISRSKEYIKKIKQARLKLSESSQRSKAGDDQEDGDDEEPKTPPKETETEEKPNEHDEDFLDVANDVNFEEDEEWDTAKNSSAKSEENSKPKGKKDDETEPTESLNASGTTNSDERPARRERSASHHDPDWASSIDLSCVHCGSKCASVQVSWHHGCYRVAHSIITQSMTSNRTFAFT